MTYHGTIICSNCDGEGIYEFSGFKQVNDFYYALKETTIDKCPTCEGSGLLEVFHKPKKLPTRE